MGNKVKKNDSWEQSSVVCKGACGRLEPIGGSEGHCVDFGHWWSSAEIDPWGGGVG